MPRTKTPPAAPTVPHLQGCPASPDPKTGAQREPGRIETYEATRPTGVTIMVAHCMECGAMAYSDRDIFAAGAFDDDESEMA